MSKAFLPEDTPPEDVELGLPERAPGPHPITRAGHRRLTEERQRLERSGENPRRLRIVERALASVVVLEPALFDDGAGFGCEVEVEDEQGVRRTYILVGPDEIEPSQGRISAASPLGELLHGAQAGDEIELARGRRTEVLEVLAVRVPTDPDAS